jgi:RNA polymerase sigma factor (sigma-70 family)
MFTTTESEPPVTQWLRQLENGQPEAARPLWEHFCRRLMNLASGQLNPKLKSVYDEEDAALSAFHSLCRVIADNRQTNLGNRENLWRLLVVITERKIIKRLRHEGRDKRDFRRTQESACLTTANAEPSSGLVGLPGREPTPEFATEFADICNSLFDELGDELLKNIVQLRLTNHSNDEIAAKLGISKRTVERKLLIIRGRWERIASEVES